MPRRPVIVALVPAHNEAADIARTIESLLEQTRRPDRIVIVSDNSADDTVQIASSYPVIVIETTGENCCQACDAAGKNTHRKSGALNLAWKLYCQDADLIVGADGDTWLPPHAVADWEAEFAADPTLAGSSSQPIMTGGKGWNIRQFQPLPAVRGHRRPNRYRRARHWLADRTAAFTAAVIEWYLPRLQRFEFAKSIRQSLNRGWVLVVSGTGCAYRNEALREVALLPGQPGPWTYESVVEDYHLTYQMRKAGWLCAMSPTVWCYTGSMITIKSLWYQRIKWTGGTDGDLLKFGCDRLNFRQWTQNAFLLMNVAFWFIWLALVVPGMVIGGFHVNWWWQGFGASFLLIELLHMAKLRDPIWLRDWKDWLLAGLMVHLGVYNVLSLSWGTVSWYKVLYSQLGDLWAPQYRAEGQDSAAEQKIGTGS